ncbi:hypothetical protein [Nocardia terpenica]|nr:hypothetical protein [Nocardia terpenica]
MRVTIHDRFEPHGFLRVRETVCLAYSTVVHHLRELAALPPGESA